MAMTTELRGQVAVVTGAGRGIGRAIALALAHGGMRIVCSARNVEEIEDTVSKIVEEGGEAIARRADVTSPGDMELLMVAAPERFGRLDFVLLNAGVTVDSHPFESFPIEVWNQCIQTNLTGAFLGIRAAIPHLRASGGGKIIGVGSGASIHAPAGRSPYAASKAGLTALIRSASRELRPLNIAVNELQPGPTATAMHGITLRDVTDSAFAELPAMQRGPEGDWFKPPSVVAELALFIAKLPNNGPTGQIFSLNTFR